MEKLKIKFVKRHMIRRYGSGPVEILEEVATKYIRKGFARLAETPSNSSESSLSSESIHDSGGSRSVESSSSSGNFNNPIIEEANQEDRVSVRIKKNKK